MAITWGAWNGHMKAGIEATFSGTTMTVKYYYGIDGWDYSDPQIMVPAGAISGGNINYTNNLTGSHNHQQGSTPPEYALAGTKTLTIVAGKSYTVRGTVSGTYDGSAPTTVITVTAPGSKPTVPTNVTHSGLTATDVTIAWGEPSSWGGDDDGTFVAQVDENVSFGSPTTKTVTAMSAAFGGLTPATQYHYRVAAKNSAGQGPYSATLTFTTDASGGIPPGVPGGPTYRNITASSAHASWTPSSLIGGSGPMTGYNFKYSLAADMSNAIVVTGLPPGEGISPPGYQIPGLLPNTTYYSQAQGVSTTGISAYGPITSFKTLAGAKVFESGVFVVAPSFVRISGVFQPIAPQKRKNGVWGY